MKHSQRAAFGALLMTAVASVASGQGGELTPEQTLEVQRTLADTWAWGAGRSSEDQRAMRDALPVLERTLAQQKAVLDSLEVQLAAAEQDQDEVQAQAAAQAAPVGFPAWLGAAGAAAAGAALGAAGMRFYGQRKKPAKPA